jgi:hypothetical protein
VHLSFKQKSLMDEINKQMTNMEPYGEFKQTLAELLDLYCWNHMICKDSNDIFKNIGTFYVILRHYTMKEPIEQHVIKMAE